MGFKYKIQGDTMTIKLESTMQSLPVIERCKDFIIGFQVIEGSMDDAFINITGKEIRE